MGSQRTAADESVPAQEMSAEDKKNHKPVNVEVTHKNGWPYRGAHYNAGAPLTVPKYVLDGNPEFIKERSAP